MATNLFKTQSPQILTLTVFSDLDLPVSSDPDVAAVSAVLALAAVSYVVGVVHLIGDAEIAVEFVPGGFIVRRFCQICLSNME